jgi:glycerol uptake facilitator-like aquaporin
LQPKPLVAEFVGTLTLIFIGVGAIAANGITNGALGLTGIALAHGLAIGVMVSAVGYISGGPFQPVLIGLTITADITMGGPVRGAAMNPARWLGPALVGTGDLSNAWIYWIGPVAGAVIAALLWRHLLEQRT